MVMFVTVEWAVNVKGALGQFRPGTRTELEWTPEVSAEERAGRLRVLERFEVDLDTVQPDGGVVE